MAGLGSLAGDGEDHPGVGRAAGHKGLLALVSRPRGWGGEALPALSSRGAAVLEGVRPLRGRFGFNVPRKHLGSFPCVCINGPNSA